MDGPYPHPPLMSYRSSLPRPLFSLPHQFADTYSSMFPQHFELPSVIALLMLHDSSFVFVYELLRAGIRSHNSFCPNHSAWKILRA